MIQDQQAIILVLDSTDVSEDTAFIPTLMLQFLDRWILPPKGCTIPLLVLANKQDLEGAMNEDMVTTLLDLEHTAQNFNFSELHYQRLYFIGEGGHLKSRKTVLIIASSLKLVKKYGSQYQISKGI